MLEARESEKPVADIRGLELDPASFSKSVAGTQGDKRSSQ